MTEAAGKDEEMEDTVHIPLLMESIEDGTSDIEDTLGDNPDDGGCRYGVYQGLEGYQHTQSHADEAERLDVGMLLQPDETDDSSCNGTSPYKRKETPSPITLCPQRHQCQGGVRAGDMPVDGGMVPSAQPFLPFRATE